MVVAMHMSGSEQLYGNIDLPLQEIPTKFAHPRYEPGRRIREFVAIANPL